jgi:hypothetical protein
MITKEQMNTVFDLLMERHLKIIEDYNNGIWKRNDFGFVTEMRCEREAIYSASKKALNIYQSAKRNIIG